MLTDTSLKHPTILTAMWDTGMHPSFRCVQKCQALFNLLSPVLSYMQIPPLFPCVTARPRPTPAFSAVTFFLTC